MLLRLFLLFTLVPLLELILLLRLGGLIGVWPTIGLVVVTGFVGAWLARREGARSWRAVQGELASGRLPGNELLHGALVLVAGVVLVTPGVITDAAGLALLVRPVRRKLIAGLRRRFEARLAAGPGGVGPAGLYVWSTGDPARGSSGDPAEADESEPRRRPRVIEL